MNASPAWKMARLFAVLVFTCAWLAHAERMPSFDLDTCVGESKVIVQGNLLASGELEVTKVMDGKLDGVHTLKLNVGTYQYTALQKRTGVPGPIAAVAFLTENFRGEWRLALQYAGLVGFDHGAVFLGEHDFVGVRLDKSDRYTPESFLQAVANAVQARDERNRLVAAPRSFERMKGLLAFALSHVPVDDPAKNWSPDYSLWKVALALRGPSLEEQGSILEALQGAKTPDERTILLRLAGLIPLRDEALETVAAFLPRTNPPPVREAAMDALARINGYRAVDYLVPCLVPDDPQVLRAVSDLGGLSYPPQDLVLNVKAVPALAALAALPPDFGPDDNTRSNLCSATAAQIVHYLHPRLLPVLFDLALKGSPADTAQNFRYLTSELNLKYPQEDRAAWRAWQQKARPFLEPDYDLPTAAGREQWLAAYAKAEPAVQGLLMRLWFFEPNIDEAALLEAAARDDSARKVLATLWQRKRLSGATKKAIVERFLSVRLVSQPPEAAKTDKTLYGAAVVVSSTFPFPEAAWTENRRKLAIGPRFLGFEGGGWSAWSLGDKGVPMLAWADTEHASSPPQARAIMELRETDAPNSNAVLWTLRWDLGPIPLGHRPP